MLEISSQAVQQLKELKNRQGPQLSVRIGILSGQVTGSNLGVTMDEASERDQVFTFDGLEVIADRALLEFCKSISVEFVLSDSGGCGSGGGFKIVPQNPLNF